MKNYFKPNSKTAIKFALFIKGITATLVTSAYINNNQKCMLIIMIIGAVANETINLLSTKENDKNTNS